MREGKKRNKIVSLVLAAFMMVSVFAVATPQQAEAAGELSLKGKGTSTATISDEECWGATEEANFIKFKSNVTGYVTIKISNNSSLVSGGAYGYITLNKSKTSALGQTREYFDTSKSSVYYTRTYGVKKGSTYYFKVESVGGVKVKATVTSLNKGSNTSRGKAKTLKQNKTAKGVIIAGDKSVDWYKIKLTKKQQLKLSYSAKTNGLAVSNSSAYCTSGIKVTLCKSNGKPFISGSNNYDAMNLKYPKDTTTYFLENQYGARSGINPGTYYVKVERYNKTSSGYYTLKWK
ncbi:hypothetical protein [Eubacterium sp. 14-2]|uniref:hypothetical protein n=1 Tax=Eubacterium sp. 14-2 TaxID=1235790 RepID=UPI0004CE3F48|nr:hypothetical protein [Eubacterium sp. 14-2]